MSSSESELGEEDRVFAEEMGLPKGDADLLDSEHSSDEEDDGGAGDGKTRKSRKGKAAAAAAAAEAASKAAEMSWMGGGGGAGRWGGGGGGGGGDVGDGGDGGGQVAAEDGGDDGGNANTGDGNNDAIAPSGLLAVEGGGDDVGDTAQGTEGMGAGVEGQSEPATDPTLPSVAGLQDAAEKTVQRIQEAGEIRSWSVRRSFCQMKRLRFQSNAPHKKRAYCLCASYTFITELSVSGGLRLSFGHILGSCSSLYAFRGTPSRRVVRAWLTASRRGLSPSSVSAV